MSTSDDDVWDPSHPYNAFPFRKDVPPTKWYRHEVRMQHLASALRDYRQAMSDKSRSVYDRAEFKRGFSDCVTMLLDGVWKGWPVPSDDVPMGEASLVDQLGSFIIFRTLWGETFTQADVARRLGVTPAAISKIVKTEGWGDFFKDGKRGPKRLGKRGDLFSLMERFCLE